MGVDQGWANYGPRAACGPQELAETPTYVEFYETFYYFHKNLEFYENSLYFSSN